MGDSRRLVHPAYPPASVLDSADRPQLRRLTRPRSRRHQGCVMSGRRQSNNIAANAVMASQLQESVPSTSIDASVGSSQQALHFSAKQKKKKVIVRTMDCVIAAASIRLRGCRWASGSLACQERLCPLARAPVSRALSEHHVQPVHHPARKWWRRIRGSQG